MCEIAVDHGVGCKQAMAPPPVLDGHWPGGQAANSQVSVCYVVAISPRVAAELSE